MMDDRKDTTLLLDTSTRSVRGLRAIITGAASGIGAATSRLFAAEGAHVAMIDRDHAGLASVTQDIERAGGKAAPLALDLARSDEIRAAVQAAEETLGGIDIVVNNAGIASFLALDASGYDALWDDMVAINLTAVQRVVRAALPALRQSRYPRIVNIASTEAIGATMHDSAYAATKAGVTGLTRAMAVELGQEGITVNTICPGPIETPMTEFASTEDKATFARRRTALRRYGQPEEIAHMTLSLCLPAASFITGTTIPVDGGLVARNA